MDISKTSTRRLKLQNIIFMLLFLTLIGLLAILSNRYVFISDWTVNSQNSLNEVSLELLKTLDGPVDIVSYTNQPGIKEAVKELISRYQRSKPDITLNFVNPVEDPETIRNLKITTDGELIITYQGRKENLTEISEQNITNTLHRLIRAQERSIVFIQGHGERSPERQANFDLSSFSQHLTKLGFKIDTLNLANTLHVPENVSVLILAGPQASFLPAEVRLLEDYIKSGGNLLWLADPLKDATENPMFGLLPVSELLGIEILNGVVVDPTTQQLGISRPDYAVITEYPRHPVTNGFDTVTLFPQAAGLEMLPGYAVLLGKDTFTDEQATPSSMQKKHFDDPESDRPVIASSFTSTPLLQTVDRSWIETSPIEDRVKFNDLLDITGPITIGMVLTRQFNNSDSSELVRGQIREQSREENREQRVIVIGDGDFLSNTFLGNGGNLTLGENIFNWLSHDEHFISIPTRPRSDVRLELSPTVLSLLGGLFLFVIPLLLIISGSLIWYRRRSR
jgi:ABC-type uncharacterized transport system involved in gliding motility auxiliary subunit